MPLDAQSGAPRPSARAPIAESLRLAAPHTPEDLAVLAQTCWAEPIGGTLRGMEIIAATALNFWRARRLVAPNLTVSRCCQDYSRFQCWERSSPIPAPAPNDPGYAMARRVARRALNYGPFLGQAIDPTGGAAGYALQSEETPDWATTFTPIAAHRGLNFYGPESAFPFLTQSELVGGTQ